MPPTQISHQPILFPCMVDETLLGVLLIDKITAIKNSLRTDILHIPCSEISSPAPLQ